MRKEFLYPERQGIIDAPDFDTLLREVSEVLRMAKEQNPEGRVGYVSGILTSDGIEYYERNKLVLEEKAKEIRGRVSYPVFSANDIFSDELVERLGYESAGYIDFWRKVLGTGYITHVHMTKRWEESRGATDEHEQAISLGLNIVYEV